MRSDTTTADEGCGVARSNRLSRRTAGDKVAYSANPRVGHLSCWPQKPVASVLPFLVAIFERVRYPKMDGAAVPLIDVPRA